MNLGSVVRFFKKIGKLLVGPKDLVQPFLDLCLKHVPAAFPLIEFVAAITPGVWDDVALATARVMFPKFFDPTLTPDERKLYLMGVCSELLRQKYPTLSTTAARICVEIAYALRKFGAWLMPA